MEKGGKLEISPIGKEENGKKTVFIVIMVFMVFTVFILMIVFMVFFGNMQFI